MAINNLLLILLTWIGNIDKTISITKCFEINNEILSAPQTTHPATQLGPDMGKQPD